MTRAKKYSNNLSISPFASTAQNTLKLKSYIKDSTNISSEMYLIKPITNTHHETNMSDIFSSTFQWKKEKTKYKPKEYTFRVRVFDILKLARLGESRS